MLKFRPIKSWLRKFALSVAPLLFVTPANARESQVTEPTPTETRVEAKTVDADPALWVVKDEDTTIYMFGTFHFLKPGYSWFDEGIRDAFDKSDDLVMELPEADYAEVTGLFSELGIDKTGQPLRAKMSEAERKTYEDGMALVGEDPAQYEAFQPWFVGMKLQVEAIQKAGLNSEDGVEEQLKSAARQKKMPISGLETYRLQFSKLANLPLASQIAFLNSSFASKAEYQEGLDAALDSWAQPDPEKLAGFMNDGLADPALRDAMLTSRNVAWADWVKKRLEKPGTTFMAVGAGHLAGESSVPALLEKQGIKVERVNY